MRRPSWVLLAVSMVVAAGAAVPEEGLLHAAEGRGMAIPEAVAETAGVLGLAIVPAPPTADAGSATYLATRPGGGFDAFIGPDGVRVVPASGGWEVALELARVGRNGALEPVASAGVTADGPRAELRRGTLTEWFVNQEKGLEHGFTLAEPPEGEGNLVLELALETDLVAKLAEHRRGVRFLRPDLPLSELNYRDLAVMDADQRTLDAHMELVKGEGTRVVRIVVDDVDASYPVTVDPLVTTAAWSSDETDLVSDIAWGDWDGDGDLDLAAACWPARVYVNTGGTLSATPAWSASEGDYVRSVAWGDWDGDGDLDLAAGNYNQPNRVYVNSGGALASAWTSADSDSTESVAWGDWDGDGDLDLAAGNYNQPNRVYDNSGGALASAWTSSEAENTASVAWGDWDSDGDLDLAAGNFDFQPDRVYANSGGALASAWTSAESDNTWSVAWGDWDSDGDLDLVAGNWGQPDRVYENTGGALTPAWVSAGSGWTSSVAWGDWDGDGDLDLAVGNDGGQNQVYVNSGSTLQTTAAWSSVEIGSTRSVAWGDWDGDGDLELAGAGSSTRVYENNGTPLRSTASWSSVEPGGWSLAWGDWDGDGDLDLATTDSRVYENADGTLSSAWVPNGGGGGTVAWGDWDGDGDLDLAAGGHVYENTGGGLDPDPTWNSADSGLIFSYSVAWGDWDGDGDLDLAAGNVGYEGADARNRVYENTGDGLEPIAVWTSADTDNTNSVAWGDWDGDGDLDLAAGNADQAWLTGEPNRVYLNIGGALDPTPVWSSAESDLTYSVAWGDWDGDGDLDLAAGNNGNPNRVYENSGVALDPNAAWTSADSDATYSVAWGDWDGDGDLDLAAGNSDNPIRVYKNTGDGLDATAVWASTDSDYTYSVAWGDWDGDGDLDLAGWGWDDHVYENGSLNRPGRLPDTPVSPVIARRPGPQSTDAGFFFSASRCLSFPIHVEYVLVDEQGDTARRVVPEYSLVEGGPWYPASEAPGGSGTENLASQAGGLPHLFIWDNRADGVHWSDTVRFRLTVLHQAPTWVGGPIQRPAMKAISPPFGVCDPAADLWISNTDSLDTVVPGEAVAYTITVGNAGPDDVVGAAVTDAFPAEVTGVTWDCDESGGGACGDLSGAADIDETVDLPAGSSVVFTATGTVQASASGVLANTATVAISAGMSELDPEDNSATDTDALMPSTDLSVTLDDGQTAAVPGEDVIYTVVVTNAGPSAAVGSQVVDIFPPEVTSVDWTCDQGGGGTCSEAAGTDDIETTVDLTVGTFVTFTATAAVDSAATGVLVNTASVHSQARSGVEGRGDPEPGDNTAVDVDTLAPEADLGITKSNGAGFAVIGQQISYAIVVTNPGPSDALSANVTDTFPAELTGVEWTCSGSDGGSCGNPSGTDDIDQTADLPAGGSVNFVATATVDPGATVTLENTATVACPESVTERNATDNTATDTDELVQILFSDGFESGDLSAWSN